MCALGGSARPPYVSTSASAARGSWRRSAATSPLSRSSEPATSRCFSQIATRLRLLRNNEEEHIDILNDFFE